MNYVLIIWEAVAGTSLPHLRIQAANCWFMDVCDQASFELPKMRDQKR